MEERFFHKCFLNILLVTNQLPVFYIKGTMVENGLIIKNCVLSKITNRFKEIVGLFKILPRRKIFRQVVPEKFQWNALFP